MAGHGHRSTDDQERKPPTMSRSLRQLGTAYAPGALFTWEGGLGACRAVAVPTRALELRAATRDAIREQIQEYLEAWLKRGQAGEYPAGLEPLAERLVDKRVLRDDGPEVTEDKLAFVEAQQIGYEPFPLAFVCRRCELYRSSRDAATLAVDSPRFADACPYRKAGKACSQEWEQLDAVMVHWSGAVEPVSPDRLHWDRTQGKNIKFNTCSGCGGRDYRLIRQSGQFSAWKFECLECRTTRPVLVSDDFTLRLLGEAVAEGKARQAEVNMEPVSYRASSAYYPQSDKVLVFRESEWLNKLQPVRQDELKSFLGEYFGYPGRNLADAEKAELLAKVGRSQEWATVTMLKAIAATVSPEMRKGLENAIKDYEARWAKEVFTSAERGSDLLRERCADRLTWVRRFDPIRMAVEHRTLEEERFRSAAKAEDGRDACVDVTAPDRFLLDKDADRAATIDKVRRALRLLGFADMRLVRDLQVCDFSFGFTRVSSTPTVRREEKAGNYDMPVRLNLFDGIRSQERVGFPVYCLQQSNEAFYIRLDEGAVVEWLTRNHVSLAACPSERLGGLLIEQYRPFERFLTEYRRERAVTREAYPYAYTLLHTIAHQVIGVMSELSGLDLGSFGEHLFVPDLAFLVYRRGATMDLGNLSSMWRDHGGPEHGNEVLHRMLMPETLRCGSETICMTLRGGACPDCVLIPENACLTRNELLSRSVLIGRGVPRWDADHQELVGFYDVAQERAARGAA